MRTRPALALLVLGLGACGLGEDDYDVEMLRWPLQARCSIAVSGKGQKDLEGDYLPHVVNCENGAASPEALKVQAISARTFAYYKIATAGGVKDGTSDQVYSCGSQPSQKHYDAVKATSGQVLVWSSTVICSFFVAGAKPSTATCVAAAGDPDPTYTEKYVTYNAGKTGTAVKQSSLGWISPTNKYNRGCMSQNGSHCQAVKGKKYPDILKFYYGADIQIVTATGSCVTPPPPPPPPPPTPKPDAGTVKKDTGAARLDGRASALDGGAQPEPGADSGPSSNLPLKPPTGTEPGCSMGGTPAGADGSSLLALLTLALAIRLRRRR